MKLTRDQILKYSEKYDLRVKGAPDELVERELKGWFRINKYLDRQRLIKLGVWKSQRPLKHYSHDLNTDETVREITSFALSSKNEYIRIMALQFLRGVSWPVASVILHFAYPDDYMILDFRTLWSLDVKQPKQYNFDFWLKYIELVKKTAREFDVSLRTLDKALWQYSRENQKM